MSLQSGMLRQTHADDGCSFSRKCHLSKCVKPIQTLWDHLQQLVTLLMQGGWHHAGADSSDWP